MAGPDFKALTVQDIDSALSQMEPEQQRAFLTDLQANAPEKLPELAEYTTKQHGSMAENPEYSAVDSEVGGTGVRQYVRNDLPGVSSEPVAKDPYRVDTEQLNPSRDFDALKFVGTSAIHGLTGLPKFAAEIALPKGGPTSFLPDMATPVQQGIESVTKAITPFDLRNPETPGERILDVGIQGAVGGMLGPGSLARNAFIGGGSGMAGESAAQFTEGVGGSPSAQTVASIIASLGAAGGMHLLTPRPSNAAAVLKNAIPDKATEDALRASAAQATAARAEGVPMNTTDFMTGPQNPLQDVQEALILSGGGDKVTKNIRAQGPAIAEMANRTVERLPGKVQPHQTAANELQDTATAALRRPQKAASEEYGNIVGDSRRAEAARLEKEAADAAANIDATKAGVSPDLSDAAKIDSMAAGDRAAAAKEAKAEVAPKKVEELARAAGEVANPPVFAVQELGPEAVLLNSRRMQLGKPQKDQWTAQELLDAGYPQEKLDKIWETKQPVTAGKGIVQNPVEAGKGEVHPFVPEAEGHSKRIKAESEQKVTTAEEDHMAAMDAVVGQDRLDPKAIRDTRQVIGNRMREFKGDDSIQRDLNYIQRKLPTLETSKELHTFLRSIQDNLPSVKLLGSKSKALKENSVVGATIADLKKLRDTTTPGYAKADEAYSTAKGKINELRASTDLQKIATKGGSQIEQDAARGNFERIMNEGESPSIDPKDSRMSRTLLELGKENPEVLANNLRTWVDTQMQKVFGRGKTARPAEDSGEGITAFLGDASNPANDARIKGIKIAIDAVAKTSKLDRAETAALHRGFDHLRDIANANSRVPTKLTSMTPHELQQLASSPGKLVVLRALNVNVGYSILRSLQPWLEARTYRHLDELLSNPAKVEDLIKLGRQPKFSRREQTLIATAISIAVQQQAGKED